jgi:hypothetical protein
MRRLYKPEIVFSGRKRLAVSHAPGRPRGKIIDADHSADLAAHRFGVRRNCQPLIERPALVRLEMAETDPAYSRRLDQSRHLVTHHWEQTPHACMKQQRFVIADEKLIKL